MNFLGHAFLTPDNNDLRFGNFIADGVKGNPVGKYAAGVVDGIILHRKIDAFSDHHASYKALRNILPDSLKRFSGILGDMYFDHFLASRWEDFSVEKLTDFTGRYYAYLQTRSDEMPHLTLKYFPYMVAHDWLASYCSALSTARSIEQIAIRRPMLGLMAAGGDWLLEHQASLGPLSASFLVDAQGFFTKK